MYRTGTEAPTRVRTLEKSLFGGYEAALGRIQPLKEAIGKHQSPLARSIGDCPARRRQLLARPTAKIALIRFHAPLP